MGRAPCCDKLGLKKGPWTPEEDRKLIQYIQEHGHGSWRALPKEAGLLRCGKSCRLRWTNYLRPDIKRGKFSFDEEQIILQLHALLGNRWSNIATHLPGRTDNEIKNYWNTHLKKRLLQMGIDPITHRPKMSFYDSLRAESLISSTLSHMAQWESARLEAEMRLASEHLKMTCSDRSSVKLKSDWVSSDDILTRLLGSMKAPERKDPDLSGSLTRNSAHAWSMDLSSLLQKWDQSSQSQAAGRSTCSTSNFEIPIQNHVTSSISDWHDINSKLDPREMFALQELDHNSTSPTSTLSCSFADTQTLPFLETSSPGVDATASECATLQGQATIRNFEVPPEVVIGESSLAISSPSAHESLESIQGAPAFLKHENAGSDENSQIWTTENRFFSSVKQDLVEDQSLTPLVVTVASNSPCLHSDGDNNAYQAGSVMSILDISSGDNVSSSTEKVIQINSPAVLRGEDGKDYWSNLLRLVGPAL